MLGILPLLSKVYSASEEENGFKNLFDNLLSGLQALLIVFIGNYWTLQWKWQVRFYFIWALIQMLLKEQAKKFIKLDVEGLKRLASAPKNS